MENTYYFIHNYKTMGTTIISQLPDDYKSRFTRLWVLKDWEEKYGALNYFDTYEDSSTILLNHTLVSEQVKLGIIKSPELVDFLMVFRNPLERFASMCNFENISGYRMMMKIKRKLYDNRMAALYVQQVELIKGFNYKSLTIVKMEENEKIEEWFKLRNIDVDMSIVRNSSAARKHRRKKLIYSTSLSTEVVDFVNEYYKDDIDYYNNMIN